MKDPSYICVTLHLQTHNEIEGASMTIERGVYRHFKGKDYFVHGTVRDVTGEEEGDYVLYEPLYDSQAIYGGQGQNGEQGQKYIRTLQNFFQTVSLETLTLEGKKEEKYRGPRFYRLLDQSVRATSEETK